MVMHKSAWAEVRMDLVRDNLDLVRRQLAPEARLCAVLKGDAYGHGLVGMREQLTRRRLADSYAVGQFSELIRLYIEGGDDGTEVLLLGASDPEELREPFRTGLLPAERVILSVYSPEHFRMLNGLAASLALRLRVHIRTDVWNAGMGMGFATFLEKREAFLYPSNLEVCGLYTHLYSGYSGDRRQTERELRAFDGLVRQLKPKEREKLTVHVMNSALVFFFPEYCYDMVRIGSAMYGLGYGDWGRLKPILRVCGEVFAVETVDASVPLCYRSPAAKPQGPRRIARIMLGYWDSPLLLTQKDVRVRIRDRVYPLADDVCMDNLCVDVTEGDGEVAVGDTAVLLGEPGVSIQEIIEHSDIENVHNECLCMTAGRLEKVYL